MPKKVLPVAVALLALATCQLACPQRTAVSVKPGSTQALLVFTIASTEGGRRPIALSDLAVWKCDAEYDPDDPTRKYIWYVWHPGGTTRFTGEVVYGVVPNNFQERAPAEPLDLGCYIVAINGTGSAVFDVPSDGQVVQRGSGQQASSTAPNFGLQPTDGAPSTRASCPIRTVRAVGG